MSDVVSCSGMVALKRSIVLLSKVLIASTLLVSTTPFDVSAEPPKQTAGPKATAGLKDPFSEGVRLYGSGQYDEALTRFRSSLSAGKLPAQSTFYMASCYQQLGQVSDAKNTYRLVLYKFPNTAIARRSSQMLAGINAQVNDQAKIPPKDKGDEFWDDPAASKALSRPLAQTDVSVRYLRDTDQGWILLPATINGVEVHMLLDTGAGISTCKQSFLDHKGIKVSETKSKMTLVGAAGEIVSNNVIANVAIGTIHRDVMIAVIQDTIEKNSPKPKPVTEPKNGDTKNAEKSGDEKIGEAKETEKRLPGTGRHTLRPVEQAADPPILGQNFLKNLQYTIDDPRETITFFADRKTFGSAPGKDVPFTTDADGAIFVRPKINGKECEMQLDTGAALVTLADRHLAACGVNIPAEALRQKGNAGIGGSKEAYGFKLDSVQLGKVSKRNLDARVLLDTRFRKPLLGQSFLQGLKYTIDPFRKVIRFE